jgi:hypothetical protein
MQSWSLHQFLQEQNLKRGDIILLRGKRSIFSLAVRLFTWSYYSHSALVFAVPNTEEGFDKTFLIESSRDGVDITDVIHYLNSKNYDAVILRFEADWFTEDIAKLVRGHMLNFIKARYDYRGIWKMIMSAIGRIIKDKQEPFPSRFLCSGFVQYGFIAAIDRQIVNGKMPRNKLKDVIFNDRLSDDPSIPDILETVPEDLARSNKLSWKYVIRNGTVYEINSREEAEKFLRKI